MIRLVQRFPRIALGLLLIVLVSSILPAFALAEEAPPNSYADVQWTTSIIPQSVAKGEGFYATLGIQSTIKSIPEEYENLHHAANLVGGDLAIRYGVIAQCQQTGAQIPLLSNNTINKHINPGALDPGDVLVFPNERIPPSQDLVFPAQAEYGSYTLFARLNSVQATTRVLGLSITEDVTTLLRSFLPSTAFDQGIELGAITLHVQELAVSVSPAGSGSVTRSPDQTSYDFGASVQLTATPVTGWSFTGWSGGLAGSANPAAIIMDAGKSVTAGFSQNEYVLTTNVAGNGNVSRSNNGPYHLNDVVQLTATAAAGWNFTGWSGALSGSANPATLTMDADKVVSASFTKVEGNNNSSSSGGGGGGSTPTSTPVSTPTSTSTPTPTATPAHTSTPTPTSSPAPTATPAATSTPGLSAQVMIEEAAQVRDGIITVDVPTVGADFTTADASVGQVEATLSIQLNGMPAADASVTVTTSLEPDAQISSVFQLTAADSGMGITDVAYVINVEKTNLQNVTDIATATITMKVGADWVAAHGGTGAIKIFRYDADTGAQQVLETRFLGYDAGGRAIFEGISPDGLSVFGLVAVKAASKPEPAVPTPTATSAPTPTPTPIPEPMTSPTPAPISTPEPTPATVSPPELLTILSVSPENGDKDVPVDAKISVTFSGAMNKSSAEKSFLINRSVTGTFAWIDNTMIFDPDNSLQNGVDYGFSISTAARNLAGDNLASPYAWSFTTKGESDTFPWWIVLGIVIAGLAGALAFLLIARKKPAV
ncbi:MAG: Ig-like domain-containing protein [Dehalococcoidia bacterium]